MIIEGVAKTKPDFVRKYIIIIVLLCIYYFKIRERKLLATGSFPELLKVQYQ